MKRFTRYADLIEDIELERGITAGWILQIFIQVVAVLAFLIGLAAGIAGKAVFTWIFHS